MINANQIAVALLAAAFIFVPMKAVAQTITMACKFEGSERAAGDREMQVNQLFIDPSAPAVELRVAQTMGTKEPLYFGFRNRAAAGMGNDQVQLIIQGSRISMSAIRLGVPTSIVLDRLGGGMVWSWADGSSTRAYRYRCEN